MGETGLNTAYNLSCVSSLLSCLFGASLYQTLSLFVMYYEYETCILSCLCSFTNDARVILFKRLGAFSQRKSLRNDTIKGKFNWL